MKIIFIVAIVCIAAMVITATVNGIDTGVVTGGVGAIATLGTWGTVRALERKNGEVNAVKRGLKKAGYSDTYITRVTNKIKGGKK